MMPPSRIHLFSPEAAVSQYRRLLELARKWWGRRSRLVRVLASAALGAMVMMPIAEAAASAVPAVYKMLDARSMGVFNMGTAQGEHSKVRDENLKKDVVEFKFTAPRGSVVGIWTNSYPPELAAPKVNAMKIGVMLPGTIKPGQLDVTLEVKGRKGIQKFPLSLKAGWNKAEEFIDWDTIGLLREAVFVVSPKGDSDTVSGALRFDLDFVKRERNGFRLSDARGMGVFNIGDSQGTTGSVFDESVRKNVVEFKYKLPAGSSVGVWTSHYPRELAAAMVNAVKVGVMVPSAGQANQVAVTLELKGSKDIQKVLLGLKPGWNSVKEFIDWQMLGSLKEAVFVVTPTGRKSLAAGTLRFDLDFVKMAQTKKSGDGFSVLDARGLGVFNTGKALGAISRLFDQEAWKDVVKFDYSIPRDSGVGVWTKNYPAGLAAAAVNGVKIGVKVPKADQLSQIGVALEIKGSKQTQKIPLDLKPGWNVIQERIDWETIGDLKEAVFVVSPLGGTTTAGSLLLNLDFARMEFPEKDPSEGYTILDARNRGVFNIGDSQGVAHRAYDEELKKDIVKFTFTAPQKTAIGVWTNGYPKGLGPDVSDAVQIGVKVPEAGLERKVSVTLEIKGTKNTQRVQLALKEGWNAIREAINWNTIGGIKEVVFVVSPKGTGDTAPVAGSLYFDLSFGRLTFVQRNYTFIRIGLVALLSMLLALVIDILGRVSGRNRGQLPAGLDASGDAAKGNLPYGTMAALLVGVALTFFSRNNGAALDAGFGYGFLLVGLMGAVVTKVPTLSVPPSGGWNLSLLKKDFLFGLSAVLIGGSALVVFSLGAIDPLNSGFSFGFLFVALMGAVIAELLKSGITGRHLTSAEVFQNTLLSGLMAASSSKLLLLQAPATWAQVLMISNVTAALAFLIYHVANARAMATTGRHLGGATGTLIACTPYLFSWLLLLESGGMLLSLSNGITAGLLASWPVVLDTLGRFLVVFAFNEAITNGISFATRGKALTQFKAHRSVALVSLGLVVSPLIANLGSVPAVEKLPMVVQSVVAVLTAMLSQAGLWAEVYLLTGMFLDGIMRFAPNEEAIARHSTTGMRKGMAYSGILVALMYLLHMALNVSVTQSLLGSYPVMLGIIFGGLIFPLIKTLIETFDGSQPFFDRLRYSYRQPVLYARGIIVGFGFSYLMSQGLFEQAMSERIVFGLLIGLAASTGVSLLRDGVYAMQNRGRVQTWRLYFVDALMGAFVGSAAAFYLDAAQVPVIIAKFKLYTSAGFSAVNYTTYPLLNKWGSINLGDYTGGVKLLYTEALAGVINWSIAAWLFAINKTLLQAIFTKDKTPIKTFFSRQGFIELTQHMIYVLRWGLWMSPIIFTFLRMMPEATWYNQDGAIRTLFAAYNSVAMSPEAFQAWSLKVFVWVLAFDLFRILIWMDHMGLRVATLVNLSFIGMDKLDEKIAKFIGPAAAQRYIPEAVKRFTTWAPLLIPFYLPRGEQWEYAWSTATAMQNAGGGLLTALQSLSVPQTFLPLGLGVLAGTGISFGLRAFKQRSLGRREKTCELGNREYRVHLKDTGEVFSEVIQKECDVTRRSYDTIDPSGRALFIVDTAKKAGTNERFWPVAGNFPKDQFPASTVVRGEDALALVNTVNGIRTTVNITLPDPDIPAELWTITIENLSGAARELKVVPYLEWVLQKPVEDRFHTQYARLYPEMDYVRSSNAILSWQKNTKLTGFVAADVPPEGFLTSRMDFIGRARSIWEPRVLETLAFEPAADSPKYPTLDPIGALLVNAKVAPNATSTVRLLIGCTKKREDALAFVEKLLKPRAPQGSAPAKKEKFPLIGHGEILPGTPQPYSEYRNDGRALSVLTPYTTRPYDHALSNPIHSVMVTNRGLHTSCNGNSQQNRVTPDWADTVTREIPSEAIYLYDVDSQEWFSPTHHPLNDYEAKNLSEFSVDGTAVFRMTKGGLSTELTVFVPPNDPTGVYLLTVKNSGGKTRRMRVAPYFEMTLSLQPERSGPLVERREETLNAVFFENPRNIFRGGPAFASMTMKAERVETRRGRFFGTNRGVRHPYLVETGRPDATQLSDDRQIAGFLGTVDVPANGEITVAFILGQAEDYKEAVRVIRKYDNIGAVRESLEETRQWWTGLMDTVKIKTSNPEFDYYQYWLKYQALSERIWARRGFYQTSGAYGYRDQLQDTVNLMWVDPALARKQILLCASNQFIEGDVFHWYFTLPDGRTSFACRSHASDNLLWLAWAVVEYLRGTGDRTVLDEMTSYVTSINPWMSLPKNKIGWGDMYPRSTLSDTVYRHCMKSIDTVLEKRMGKNGLPLMGTGDWNDGLDEIGAEGHGESVWLGFFLYYILKGMLDTIEDKDGTGRREYYLRRMEALKLALEKTWRDDRYLRAFHDDGTEIGLKGSGVWEIDALIPSWAVMSGINMERGRIVFDTALQVLEKEETILLGWPALREDTKPYLGRSSKYPEGVRENGMYCHGVQWLVGGARGLAEYFEKKGDKALADKYRETAYRLWLKISAIPHVKPGIIEVYGGQPNKQSADMLTKFDMGRMTWHGYTGAAGWMLRQAMEGVIGASLVKNDVILPGDINKPRGDLRITSVYRDVSKSPVKTEISARVVH